ncbi:MAG: N-acetylglucosamine-6-phosphate deacetylase, partial [Treponemataceae bacterium]
MPICLHNGTLLSGFSEMPNSAVLLEDGKIADVFTEKRFLQKKLSADTRIIDVEGSFISPGLIDTHIHGFGGFGTDDGTGESVLEMSDRLADYGVTSFIPTLYPQEEKQMLETVKNITSAFGKEEGSTIMGLHLEGPFISPQKLGSLDANAVQPVSIESMKKLYDAANGKIVNMTVAPELKGMRELALYCLKKEIVLQAGHTCAEYDHMVEGMQAGILHSTHIFNAMTSMSHRNPNAAGAILIHPEMSCEIIPDGFHVHPDIIKLLFRDKPVDKIVMITDSL